MKRVSDEIEAICEATGWAGLIVGVLLTGGSIISRFGWLGAAGLLGICGLVIILARWGKAL